jgi:hypothetical protein
MNMVSGGIVSINARDVLTQNDFTIISGVIASFLCLTKRIIVLCGTLLFIEVATFFENWKYKYRHNKCYHIYYHNSRKSYHKRSRIKISILIACIPKNNKSYILATISPSIILLLWAVIIIKITVIVSNTYKIDINV